MPKPTVQAVKTLFEGWGRYLGVTIRLADGGTLKREVEDHGAAAGVFVYDPERRTALLCRQLRAPILFATGETDTLEIVAGLLEEDEDPADAVRREAMEEVGVAIGALDPVAVIQTMPGISTERIHLYLAAYRASDRLGAGGGLAGESEDITVVEMPLAELAAMADRGALVDAKTLVLLQTLRLRRPELFAAA